MSDDMKEMDGLVGMTPKDETVPEVKEEEVSLPEGKEEKPEEKVEVPEKKEEVKVDEETPEAKLNKENQRLREELNELARKTGVAPKTEELAKEVKPEPIKDEPIKFLTDEEAEELLDNPKKLNDYLNRVFQAGRERTMKDMPQLVRKQTLTEMSIQQMVTKFWSDNEDLDKYKDFVGMVANQVEIEHPDWGYDKVFDEAATLSRTRLNLPKTGEESIKPVKEEEVSLNPALPSGRRGSRSAVDVPIVTDGQQKEMDDLLKMGQ